ncbi:MAG: hypothetical protein ACOC5K_02195 [Chloroflexota bacterium]
MVRVVPIRVSRRPESAAVEVLLECAGGDGGREISMSPDRGRQLAMELHGMAYEQCSAHHLAQAVAGAFDSCISSAIISEPFPGTFKARMQLTGPGGERSETGEVDVAAALAIAVHLNLPMYLHSERLPEPEEGEEAPAERPSDGSSGIPRAFLEALEDPEEPR